MLMFGRPEAKADTRRDDLGAEFHFCRMSRDSVFAISYKGNRIEERVSKSPVD
jgi:hypothetical protein